MVGIGTHRWESVERWSPMAFLLAGASLLLVLAVTVVVQTTAIDVPDIAYWPLFPFAIAAALAGLVGLYPRLRLQSPRAASGGLAIALTGCLVLIGGLAVLAVVAPPGSYPSDLGLLGVPFLVGLLAFVLAFGVFGMAGLRTATPNREAAGVLLGTAAVQLGELAVALFVVPAAASRTPAQSEWYLVFEVATYGVIVAAMVALSFTVRTEAAAEDHDDRDPDTVAV